MQKALSYPQFGHEIFNQPIIKQQELLKAFGYLTFIALGFSAIQSLAMHLVELVPLHVTAPLVVLPSIVIAILLGNHFKELGRLALMGLLAGIIAVTIYDVSRVPFAILGVWGDFIPKIGGWALNMEDAPAIIGYSWRYIGNGGGMGVAFVMINALFKLKGSYTVRGVLFGVFVFLCLVAILIIARPVVIRGNSLPRITTGRAMEDWLLPYGAPSPSAYCAYLF